MPDPTSQNPRLAEIYRQAARVARGGISVLIGGESGTGKELLARYLHLASGAGPDKLVALNCASLPRDLLETELFGIEKGVATGVEARRGKFELAHGGTLFLDEIGDMAKETQAKILRVLQEKQVYRVGGREPRPAEVRVVSATNRHMDEMIESGTFRRDLYHRIADWTVTLPPLRQRKEDLPNLASHFLERACKACGIRFGGISRGALATLKAYPWPGNVRELEREMERVALFLNDGEMLVSSMLQDRIRQGSRCLDEFTLNAILLRAERRAIVSALEDAGGNVVVAAAALGLGRSTLYRRIKELDLDV
jgi:transcriptional regulator with PAS, ATPase and Fis domain